ncbi:MAG: hypothetical protein IJV47_05500 [Candidatus Methanomethylophilaceae archaeon]|nr:hypothetical protein [Candidatus Methanomethylophilaceae archaeon]MBQ9690043.1 hypothetical protein [Candidatus Methanomethylophilaceae archaeon]
MSIDEAAMAEMMRLRRQEDNQMRLEELHSNQSPELWVCPICGSKHFDRSTIGAHTMHCNERNLAKAQRLIGRPVHVPVERAGPGIVIQNMYCKVMVRYIVHDPSMAWDNVMIPAEIWTLWIMASEVTEMTDEEFDEQMEEITKDMLQHMRGYLYDGLI